MSDENNNEIATVRYNKANDQKYVTIPKDSNISTGDKVLIRKFDPSQL